MWAPARMRCLHNRKAQTTLEKGSPMEPLRFARLATLIEAKGQEQIRPPARGGSLVGQHPGPGIHP